MRVGAGRCRTVPNLKSGTDPIAGTAPAVMRSMSSIACGS